MNTTDEYNTYIPICIQNYFLRNCKYNFNNNYSIKELFNMALKNGGCPIEYQNEDILYNFANTMMNLNFFSIYLYENKEKIKQWFKEEPNKTEDFEKYLETKYNTNSKTPITYNELLDKIRTSFAHNNYKLIDNKIIIFNKEREKKEITFNSQETLSDFFKNFKKNYSNYSISRIKEKSIIITNYNKHTETNTFEETFDIEFINILLSKVIYIIINYLVYCREKEIKKNNLTF